MSDTRPYAIVNPNPGFIVYDVTGIVAIMAGTQASSFNNKPMVSNTKLYNNTVLLINRDPNVSNPGETAFDILGSVNGNIQKKQSIGIYSNQEQLFVRLFLTGDDKNSNVNVIMFALEK